MRATLCTNSWVRDYILHHILVLCTTDLPCAPWTACKGQCIVASTNTHTQGTNSFTSPAEAGVSEPFFWPKIYPLIQNGIRCLLLLQANWFEFVQQFSMGSSNPTDLINMIPLLYLTWIMSIFWAHLVFHNETIEKCQLSPLFGKGSVLYISK